MNRRRESSPPADLVAFCESEHEPLVRFLSLYCGATLVAEELAQEALVRTCQQWPKVRAMASPRAWLRRVAINAANSYFRRWTAEKRARRRLEAHPCPVDSHDRTDAVVLMETLHLLSPRQRTVLLMRYFDGFSLREIAESLDCSENTVKSLLRRGLSALRETETIKSWKGVLDVV